MKKISFYLSILLAFVFLINITDATAQRRSSNDEYFDESGNFASRLWYGGGFNLGFTGNGSYNVFSIGISPMVGYKIVENVSIGPRVSLTYTHVKGTGTDGRVHKVEPVDYGAGVFGRFKFIQNFFAQVEFELESRQNFYVERFTGLFILDGNEVFTERVNRENFYIGAGYTSGGIFAYEIMVLYNTSIPEDDPESPFNYRVGFTYNF